MKGKRSGGDGISTLVDRGRQGSPARRHRDAGRPAAARAEASAEAVRERRWPGGKVTKLLLLTTMLALGCASSSPWVEEADFAQSNVDVPPRLLGCPGYV